MTEMNNNNNTMQQIRDAAQRGDIELLYNIIEHDDEDVLGLEFMETPLHIAARAGHLSFATEMMKLKPSYARTLDRKGMSPIHIALQEGQKAMVRQFVEVDPELVRVQARQRITALHWASDNGDVELMTLFLTACPGSIYDITVRGETALHIAASKQRYEALRFLVGWVTRNFDRGLKATLLNRKDLQGNNIMHLSVLLKNSQMVHLLVSNGIDVNEKNLAGLTPLDLAASNEITAILVKGGDTITDLRRGISENQWNTWMLVALLFTITYTALLSLLS